MEAEDYLRLQDDGCPNCREHMFWQEQYRWPEFCFDMRTLLIPREAWEGFDAAMRQMVDRIAKVNDAHWHQLVHGAPS